MTSYIQVNQEVEKDRENTLDDKEIWDAEHIERSGHLRGLAEEIQYGSFIHSIHDPTGAKWAMKVAMTKAQPFYQFHHRIRLASLLGSASHISDITLPKAFPRARASNLSVNPLYLPSILVPPESGVQFLVQVYGPHSCSLSEAPIQDRYLDFGWATWPQWLWTSDKDGVELTRNSCDSDLKDLQMWSLQMIMRLRQGYESGHD
ncbi:hypothetical protein BDR06DRAFT_977227 [Suillus hirtellus]|nr:hypothetical protein BDR06DRAFT_977227 [Suillus hirtellus]